MTERDIEVPHEVTPHYFIYCLYLRSGKLEWKKEFPHRGFTPAGVIATRTNGRSETGRRQALPRHPISTGPWLDLLIEEHSS